MKVTRLIARVTAGLVSVALVVAGGLASAAPAQAITYDPTFVSAGYTNPVCLNGVLDNDSVVTSFNDPGGLESITFSLDGVPLPGFPYALATGTSFTFNDVVPADTPVGNHTLTVDNYGFNLATYPFTLSDPCVAVSPSDFTAEVYTQYTNPDGTIGQVLALGNFSEASRQAVVWVNDVQVWAPVLAAGDLPTFKLSIPTCQTYSVKVSFGFPDLALDTVQPAYGCGLAPVRLTGPSLSGTARVGYILTCNVSYSGTAPITAPYKWYLNGVLTAGSSRTLTLTATHYNKRVACASSASNAFGSVPSKTSASSAIVALGFAPHIISSTYNPKITGTVKRGYTVKAYVGRWTAPVPTAYAYQWYKDGRAISGATRSYFKIPWTYRYHKLSVRITASKTGYARGYKFSPSYTVR